MRRWTLRLLGFALLYLQGSSPVTAQRSNAPYKAPRTEDGQPDLEGVWQARNTAAASLEAHGPDAGIRAGGSVIVDPPDGKIPYLSAAIAKREENYKNRGQADPVNKCFSPGVPRMMYMPYPFQLVQTTGYIAILSEFGHTTRTVYMGKKGHYADAEFWMGDSRGHWDGETLVVDVTDFNADTWLDASGDFHSNALHVVERFTRTSPEVLTYEATITDPNVYSKPWTIRMPLYLDQEPHPQLYEYECHAYSQPPKEVPKP